MMNEIKIVSADAAIPISSPWTAEELAELGKITEEQWNVIYETFNDWEDNHLFDKVEPSFMRYLHDLIIWSLAVKEVKK